MNQDHTYYFDLLKSKVIERFLSLHSAPSSVKDWNGHDIVNFQEDLFEKVKGRVSEKWFYTYFKNNAAKLPRIDMLNLLSEYAGYNNWNDLKTKHSNTTRSNSNIKKVVVSGLILAFLSIVGFKTLHKNEFQFCFIDHDKGEPINTVDINIKVLQDEESPLHFKTDSLGCFTYRTNEDKIMFIVESPYHKTDTIVRFIDSNKNQIVKLVTDDYALMLDYYTNGKLEDWKQRKLELQKLISDDAIIYQLFSNDIGVEIYSKDDFIRMLTIPTSSLKRIKIVDKTLQDGQIVKLKFMIL